MLREEQSCCTLCPRMCRAVREEHAGNGFCRMGRNPVVARAALHFDEEPIISGTRGSGAVFFSGCALKCRFCQNYALSHDGYGKEITVERLREIYRELIGQGAHNINLVNPTHFTDAILESLSGGLPVPVVWNTGGYERAETIRRLDGVVSIYLPDLKYIRPDAAKRYSGAEDYFEHASKAIQAMKKQVGPVRIDDDGMMVSGVMIRHLILPGRADESIEILKWIADNLEGVYISLMAQYLPYGNVCGVDQLERRITQDEYDRVYDAMIDLGLEAGFGQEQAASAEVYIPKFDLTGV